MPPSHSQMSQLKYQSISDPSSERESHGTKAIRHMIFLYTKYSYDRPNLEYSSSPELRHPVYFLFESLCGDHYFLSIIFSIGFRSSVRVKL